MRAWPAVSRLGLHPGADPDRLAFVDTVDAVARTAGFIQEAVPEDLGAKRAVLAATDEVAGADVVIASSTSGLRPTALQAGLRHPGRVVVGHPFNPVYLLPLVEVVAGERTTPDAVDRTRAVYADLDMHPLIVRRETDGFVADRLLEAVWREQLHLLAEGVAIMSELDEALVYGPGLRWAAMGTNLTYHLGGGEGGMRHMLTQFGPALAWPWARFEAPPLTEALTAALVDGTRDQAAGRSVAELERLRDEADADRLARAGGARRRGGSPRPAGPATPPAAGARAAAAGPWARCCARPPPCGRGGRGWGPRRSRPR